MHSSAAGVEIAELVGVNNEIADALLGHGDDVEKKETEARHDTFLDPLIVPFLSPIAIYFTYTTTRASLRLALRQAPKARLRENSLWIPVGL